MQTTVSQTHEENRQIAACLREAAQLLADQGANPYRVAAYRASADTIESLDDGIRMQFDAGGVDALDALPEVGTGVAQAIAETGAPLVDVSSGVESAPGLKDVDKIAAFLKATGR